MATARGVCQKKFQACQVCGYIPKYVREIVAFSMGAETGSLHHDNRDAALEVSLVW